MTNNSYVGIKVTDKGIPITNRGIRITNEGQKITDKGIPITDKGINVVGNGSYLGNRNKDIIQNRNPQSSVFSSGTTENLKANNGHPFL